MEAMIRSRLDSSSEAAAEQTRQKEVVGSVEEQTARMLGLQALYKHVPRSYAQKGTQPL